MTGTSRLSDLVVHERSLALFEGPALLSKYLRLRRDWQSADPGSGLHRRLAQDLAELERAFGDKGITPFADTQPWGQVDQDFEKRMPKAD